MDFQNRSDRVLAKGIEVPQLSKNWLQVDTQLEHQFLIIFSTGSSPNMKFPMKT